MKHFRAAIAFMAIISIFLIALDFYIASWEQDENLNRYIKQTETELELIGTFVTEPILQYEFEMVEQFIVYWGDLQKDIVSLRAYTPDGSLLAEYESYPKQTEEVLVRHHSVEFVGQHLIDLEIKKDLSAIRLHNQIFTRKLVLNSIFIAFVIGFLLWLVLRLLAIKPLEVEIEKRRKVETQLKLAHDNLERLVEERTQKLKETNIELHREIEEKVKLHSELIKVQKLESISMLAGGIAHDFNNILTAILGNLNLALNYTEKDDKRHHLLLQAEKASLRAKDLTHQLLTFSKGGEPVKSVASVEEVIRDSASFVLRGSNCRCEYSFAEGLWPVEIDIGQIGQVIQNIVINAAHAMPEGGIIDIKCENSEAAHEKGLLLNQEEKYVKILIIDNGIGIHPDQIDKIFDPFYSTKHEGSGLGLAICHSIVKKHGGHIAVDSVLCKGTTFTIYVPAWRGKNKDVNLQEENILTARYSGKVLIMDDEEMVRSVAQEMLTLFGFDVTLATNGDEAIYLYGKELQTEAPFDFIIMDLTVPGGMGGKEAAKEILKINPDAKIVVASGYSNDPVMANFKDYGFSEAITKPFQLKNIHKAISGIFVAD